MIIFNYLKHNHLTRVVYDKYLNFRNRKVQAYVFIATTGRSGSLSLRKIFSGVKDCVSLHEPYPVMLNSDIERSRMGNDLISIYDKKLVYIKRAAINKRFYVESNHLLVKNFFHTIADKLPCSKIKIIHLVRDPVKVASSFYMINTIPGKTKNGKLYLIDPSNNNNEIQLSELLEENGEYSHDFYKCLWYWYEVEARINKLKSLYKKIDWFTIKTESLNDICIVTEMMKFVGIPMTDDILALVGSKLNLKSKQKVNALDVDVEEKHDNFKRLMAAKGYK